MKGSWKSTKFWLAVLSLILLYVKAKDGSIFCAGLTIILGFYGASNVTEKRLMK